MRRATAGGDPEIGGSAAIGGDGYIAARVRSGVITADRSRRSIKPSSIRKHANHLVCGGKGFVPGTGRQRRVVDGS